MSIYGTFGGFDDDDWGDDRQAPLVYRGSHILPRITDKRGGSLDLAHIAGFITRDGNDGTSDSIPYWPYLRVSLDDPWHEGTIVLDVHQVDQLIADLQSWRDNVDMGRLDK